MSTLTKAARDQLCTVRLPGCSGGGPDTVAAHYRSVSIGSGMGIKPNDLLCADTCFPCHELVDGRRHIDGYSKEEIRLAHAEGVLRTITARFQDGHIQIGKSK